MSNGRRALVGFAVVIAGALVGLLYTTRGAPPGGTSGTSDAKGRSGARLTTIGATTGPRPGEARPAIAPRPSPAAVGQQAGASDHPPGSTREGTPTDDLEADAPVARLSKADRENLEAIEATPAEIAAYTRRRAALEAAADREALPDRPGALQESMDDYARRYNQIAVDVFGAERARPFFMQTLRIDTTPVP